MERTLDDVLVRLFASSDVRSRRSAARARRNVVSADKNSLCARVSDIETTGEHFAQRLRNIIFQKERVQTERTSELSEVFSGAIDSLIGVMSAREITVVRGAT